LPRLTEEYYLNFYGGEPLLSFKLIRQVVSFLKDNAKKQNQTAHYSLTTNGILLTDEIIQFLDEHKFSVELSFDGLAQDVSRQKGSGKKLVPIIKELSNQPNIDLEINSVFSPDTVGYLSDSIQYIMDLGIPDIRCSISTTESWNPIALRKLESEMSRLRESVVEHYNKKGNIPVIHFRERQRKGIFHCAAGKDRLAISPDGGIWGCFLFPDYFKGKENTPEYSKFFFGNLGDFIENHGYIYPRISSNYAELRMENFRTSKTECFLCKEYKNCAVCPINAALSGASLGQIPDHICAIQKIVIREKENFRKELRPVSERPIN
jgi:sulfatase maturation enzyme AslB (radical SAM superfamily)